MVKSILLNTLRILLTIVFRLALVATAAVALCGVGVAMALGLIFNGPSEAARDQMTMTLLESELTEQLPAFYLGDELVAQISAPYHAPLGTSDPSLVAPSAQGEIRTETVTAKAYTATITLYPSSDALQGITGSGDRVAGFNADGVLVLADSFDALLEAEVYTASSCSAVLILNGRINEPLFNGPCGYAPYTAIGQCADGTVIEIVTDGWTLTHPGATCRDLINLMQQYGAVNACILASGVN